MCAPGTTFSYVERSRTERTRNNKRQSVWNCGYIKKKRKKRKSKLLVKKRLAGNNIVENDKMKEHQHYGEWIEKKNMKMVHKWLDEYSDRWEAKCDVIRKRQAVNKFKIKPTFWEVFFFVIRGENVWYWNWNPKAHWNNQGCIPKPKPNLKKQKNNFVMSYCMQVNARQSPQRWCKFLNQ